MIPNKEIKIMARKALHGQYSSFIILFLTAYILESLIVSIPSNFLAAPKNLPLFISQILLTVLLQALGSMVMLGVNLGALQLIRGKRMSLGNMFFTFRNQADHFLALELIFTAINTVASVPGFVFVWISNSMNMNFLTYSIISSLFTGLATVLTFLFTLAFSMSEFLMLDDPNLTAKEALLTSMRLIQGHTGQYFLLIASFLFLIILGFTSAMIGFIWLTPYIMVSQALFYENLCDLEIEHYQSYDTYEEE